MTGAGAGAGVAVAVAVAFLGTDADTLAEKALCRAGGRAAAGLRAGAGAGRALGFDR
jgi:hypothetical protein